MDTQAIGRRVRGLRRGKGWTQIDLAKQSDVSRMAIQLLEGRLRPGHQPSLTTLERVAAALGVRASFLIDGESDQDTPGPDSPTTPDAEGLGKQPPAPETLIDLGRNLAGAGRWEEAEQLMLQARSRYPDGSAEWAEITIRYCAQLREQLGDVIRAERYIADAERRYSQRVAIPDPWILALAHNQRGWLFHELYGYFDQANWSFRASQAAVEQVRRSGAEDVSRSNVHFLVWTMAATAMLHTDTFLTAFPETRAVPDDLAVRLVRRMESSEWKAMARDNDPRHHNLECIVDCLICPTEALPKLLHYEPLFRERNLHYEVSLNRAQMENSQGQWKRAQRYSAAAFEGNVERRYPRGVALAVATNAYARLHGGLTTTVDIRDCLDRWVLALLLSPIPQHPFCRVVERHLRDTGRQLAARARHGMRQYQLDLDERIAEQSDFFRVLRQLHVPRQTESYLRVRGILVEQWF